ncbi:MAG TPA: TraR/DksA family transcriptional regulator [Anaeromyxobacter sp.]
MASTLTKVQLDELRQKLERERARILQVLGAPGSDPPRADQDSEPEEAAQRETERSRAFDVDARERGLLAEVEHALGKFAAGTYGVGESSGDPIPYERLAVMPWARDAVGE